MKENGPARQLNERRARSVRIRNVAAHQALRFETNQESKRMLQLALNEAEALACQSGVPELVMVTLAEEKVRATRQWLARQRELKSRSFQWDQWDLAA